MVSNIGVYHAPPFKGCHGFTQVNLLSPMLLKISVFTVMRHWVTVVSADEAGPDILGRYIQRLTAYFYTKNSLIN